MGLQLNVSNSLYQLVEYLAFNLKKPLPGIFQPHFIVTQTLGMNNWLKVQIADRLDIAANCQFLKPNDIINQVYFLLDGPREQVLTTDNLQWIIFGLLEDQSFKRRYPMIAQYYENQEDIKRMALAEKIADLFDQYQIYRPEMIQEWNEVEYPVLNESNWQKFLWIEAKNIIGERMPDKTRVGKFIIDTLQNPSQQSKLKQRIPQIDFFGISIITAYHLEVFHELAKYIDISFNLLKPAPAIYWFEDKSPVQIARWNSKMRQEIQLYSDPIEGNALLTNWGQVIQNTFSLFFKDDSFLNEYDDTGIEPKPASFLSKIQNDIYNNLVSTDRNKLTLQDIEDGSIRINSCYTPVREIEVLYNYLVSLVNQQPGHISPRDIVVMVSDIDAYAPYIKAIFHSAPYKFPFTIADESIQSVDGLIGALHSLLELNEENFKAEEVLQLLEWSYIRKRFNIVNTELIRSVIDEANIRFGIEGKVEDDTIHVSWLNGLDRIMYGICMLGDEEYIVNNHSFYPLNRIEGEQAFELIRFSHFVKVLISIVNDQKKDRTLIEWGDYILQAVANLIYQSEDEDDEDYQLLINYVKKLNLISENVQEKISFHVFKHNFLHNISGETRAGNFASGGITFCSLIPMRSIPFKIVALIGLGFDKFPRKEVPLNFNLMQKVKKRGDRNIKENDKHLFLETILSAQEHLYISYIGKNTKDNSLLPPSAVVDELIDYIASGTELNDSFVRQQLVVQHPLHNFSSQPPGIFNYLAANKLKGSATSNLDSIVTEPVFFEEVSIEELINFFKNPFQHYHNKILNIFYREEEILLRETEYFELDKLQEWKIRHDLLYLKEDELNAYIHQGIKKGDFPLKNMSHTLLNSIDKELTRVKKLVQESKGDHEEKTLAIELKIGKTVITGKLNQVYGDRLVQVSFSKKNNKNVLEVYIKHLIALASGYNIESHLIIGAENAIYKISKDAMDELSAKNKLAELLGCYQNGCEKPFVFYPGFENDPEKLAKFDYSKYQGMLNKIFKNEEFPCQDQYIVNEYNTGFFDDENIFNEFLTNSELVFSETYKLFKIN